MTIKVLLVTNFPISETSYKCVSLKNEIFKLQLNKTKPSVPVMKK